MKRHTLALASAAILGSVLDMDSKNNRVQKQEALTKRVSKSRKKNKISKKSKRANR